jgi:hypothetical protein
MAASVTAPVVVLDGRQVRQLTRRSAAHRADTTLMTRLMDAWSTIASVGIGLAVLGGWLASLRVSIATRPPTSGAGLPGTVTTAVASVVAVAGLASLLDRLGPISASPAAAAWWLPLPAGRRSLLRGELVRLTCTGLVVTAGTAATLALALADGASPGAVAGTVLGATATAGALVGAVVLLQTRGRGGRLAPAAGAVAVAVSAAGIALAAAPATPGSAGSTWGLPSPGPLGITGATAVAVVLLALADRGLGRLGAGQLRAVGATSSYAAASALSLDTRELGRALAAVPRRAPRRSLRFRRVRRPWQAIVAADLALMGRSPGQLGRLVVAAAVAVLAARTEGIDRLPVVVWAGLVLGWLVAAVAVGHPARSAQAQPALDRLLPLSAPGLLAARSVTPALLLTLVCGVSGLLVGLGTGAATAWMALALAAVPSWTAATLRGAYRPELDWSGPVMSTPMGVLPVGVGATLLNGIDVGVLGALPVGGILLVGGPPSALAVGVQLGWSTMLAVGAFALTTRRRASPAG